MARGRVFFSILITSLGCAPQAPVTPPASPEAVPPAPPPPVPATAPTAASPEEVAKRYPVVFEPVAQSADAPETIPQLSISSPLPGSTIPVQKAPNHEIILKAAPWPAELRLVLALDDFPPRVFEGPDKRLPLKVLVPENRELEPGPHRLVAAIQLPDGTTARTGGTAPEPTHVAIAGFWIGSEAVRKDQAALSVFNAPCVLLLSPRGTFNGNQAADSVLLDFHVLGASLAADAYRAHVQLLVAGEVHETVVTDNRVLNVAGLPSGDHTVTVTLLAPDGNVSEAAYASAARTITVNRDAPVK